MATETRAAFARRCDVNRSTVNRWEAKGLLVLTAGDLVDVEATQTRLAQRPETYRGGKAKQVPPLAPIPEDHSAADTSATAESVIDLTTRTALLCLLRPAAAIVAAAVMEAGGSLELAFASSRLAESPLIEAATLALHAMGHPEFADPDEPAELRPDTKLFSEPDWSALALAAGVPLDLDALQARLDANPICHGYGDDDPRRFLRDLAAHDVTG